MKLEDIRQGIHISGLIPNQSARVVNVEWHGSEVLTIVFRRLDGSIADQILYRSDEAKLSPAAEARPWRFDADGNDFRLVAAMMRLSCFALCLITLYGCASAAYIASDQLGYVASGDIGVGYRETLMAPGRFHIVYENDRGTCEQAAQLALRRAGELCGGKFTEIPMDLKYTEIRSCDSHAYRPCSTVIGQAWVECVP